MFTNGENTWMDKVLRIINRNGDKIELWQATPLKVETIFCIGFCTGVGMY